MGHARSRITTSCRKCLAPQRLGRSQTLGCTCIQVKPRTSRAPHLFLEDPPNRNRRPAQGSVRDSTYLLPLSSISTGNFIIRHIKHTCHHVADLQLKPYRTEEFMHKLYYETSRFSAFGHQWVVKAFVNKNQRDPTQSSQREITYQVPRFGCILTSIIARRLSLPCGPMAAFNVLCLPCS